MLCGYGRGKFDRNTMGKFNLDFHFMFRIKTCDDFVYREKMMTVKEVMAEQRAKDPQAKIAYHSVFDIASTDKDAFGVKLEHEVFVIPGLTSDDEGDRANRSTKTLWLGSSPPTPSRTHTASWRHGLSSGLPRVWALSVRWWSSSSNRATSLLAS